MKMIKQKEYQEICTWMHQNARPLELALWNYYFENGKKEAVVDALTYYQNEDGGFGNAVEPDCWNTNSSPYATLTVIGTLRKIGFMETAGTEHPMIQGIFLFLESGVHCGENGWDFSIPSNDTFPRAPWWTYDEEENKLQNLGITAGLCSFILRYGKKDGWLYQKAMEYTKQILTKVRDTKDFGEMGSGGVATLLEDIKQSGLESSYACEGLMEKIGEVINQTIERDTEKWQQYTPRPSQFIETKQSPFYKGNEEIVNKELDYLIETRNPEGVWNITWLWYGMEDTYSKEFAVSENWWMGITAIQKLGFLKSFGRIEKES